MKKMIWVAISEDNKSGDSWDLIATFDRADAVKTAENEIAHMVTSELKRYTISVQGYELEVEDGMSAKEAWREYNLNGEFVDPAEYQEIDAVKVDVTVYEEVINEDKELACGDELASFEESGDIKDVQYRIALRLLKIAEEHGCKAVAEICDAPLHQCASWAIEPGDAIEALDTLWDDSGRYEPEWTDPRIGHDY